MRALCGARKAAETHSRWLMGHDRLSISAMLNSATFGVMLNSAAFGVLQGRLCNHGNKVAWLNLEMGSS